MSILLTLLLRFRKTRVQISAISLIVLTGDLRLVVTGIFYELVSRGGSRLPGKFVLPLGLEICASYQECYELRFYLSVTFGQCAKALLTELLMLLF